MTLLLPRSSSSGRFPAYESVKQRNMSAFLTQFPASPRLNPSATGKADLMRQKMGGAEPDSLEVCDIECGNAQGSRQGTPTRCPGREAQQLASLPSVSRKRQGVRSAPVAGSVRLLKLWRLLHRRLHQNLRFTHSLQCPYHSGKDSSFAAASALGPQQRHLMTILAHQ